MAESVVKLVSSEVMFAKKNILNFIFQGVVFLTLLLSLWATILVIGVLALHNLLNDWLFALGIVAAVNALFLGITAFLLKRRSKKFYFLNNAKALVKNIFVELLQKA